MQSRSKKLYLTMGFSRKDTATKTGLVAVGGANGRLKVRTQSIKESKLIEVSGIIRINFF